MSQHAIRFEVIMDAGNGAQKAGDILIGAFSKRGNYVFIEPMIPAEISPPKRTPYSMSGVVIRVADYDISNIGSGTDLMVIEHEILLDRRLIDREYLPGAIALLDMGDEPKNKEAYKSAMDRAISAGLRLIPFQMDDEAKKIMGDMGGNGKNMFYLGMLTKIFNVSREQLEANIRSTFKKLSEEKLKMNLAIFDRGYACAEAIDVSYEIAHNPIEGDKLLMDGNTAISMGIIDAGIKMYCGYPITPASSIMHVLAKQFPQYGGIVHQAEDEISAIGSAVGSYYAGVPSITGTSGPGLSLKEEFIGLATSAEIPLIVIDVQRGGPSTGLPTKTEQSDLPAAIFGTHGDNTKVVVSVGNVTDCFYVPHVARYLTEALRVPVIVLSDYQTSVSYKVFEKPELSTMDKSEDIQDFVLERFGIKRLDAVQMVRDSQSVPGEIGGTRRVTGLNTAATGQIAYTSDSALRSHDIRNKKIQAVRDALLKPELIGEDSGDVLVVAWGSTQGALEEAVQLCRQEGLKVSGLSLKIVYPLPPQLKDIFSKFKKVVTAEVAYSDKVKPAPLAMMIRTETLVDVESAIGGPSGRPITPYQIVSTVKEVASCL